jgi:hypothetical protein
MKVSILDLHCLNAVVDDYETIASIVDDVRRSSHGNIDAGDIATCIADLVREGMVDVYRFESKKGTYARMACMPDHLDAAWFRITEGGRKQLDDHWVDD